MIRRPASSLLAVALSLVLGMGCFAFEEIDKGMKELERFDGKSKAEPAQPATTPTEQAKKPVSDWWEKARTLGSEPRDAGIVRCQLDGGTQFMKREDCLGRGGKVRP